jgi:indole-3-glycerol phosphate synthase
VAESGIASKADVARLRTGGVHAFLIGETFMRAADPGKALKWIFY